VDSANGAAVRIAMTVAKRGSDSDFAQQNSGSDPLFAGSSGGRLQTVTNEETGEYGEVHVNLAAQTGLIHADLTMGTNTVELQTLQANKKLACPGVQLSGQGFVLSSAEATVMCATSSAPLIKRYLTGRDLAQTMREQFVIDTHGLDRDELRTRYPDAFQWLHERVKPEREQNPRETYRKNWWKHAETRAKFREAILGLSRFIVTSRTARHRTFQFIDANALPETKVLILAFSDAFVLGVLQSSAHVSFADRMGGWLGVGNDSTYNHSDCFEKFPFPAEDTGLTPELRARIANLAEQIDHHRKRVLGLLPSTANHSQAPDTLGRGLPGADFWACDSMRPPAIPAPAQHSQQPKRPPVNEPTKNLTLTGLYNVLEALKQGRSLTPKEKQIHTLGLVGVLKDLHDDLDAAVLQAYGWTDHPDAQELLVRLVALNARRATEEKIGMVRWLRPEFQNPSVLVTSDVPSNQALATRPTGQQADLALDAPAHEAKPVKVPKATSNGLEPQPWPATLPDQVRAVAAVLAGAPIALSLEAIEARFKSRGAWKKSLPRILDTLEALGRARREGDGWRG
jgi:hypothetical protein